VWRGRFLEENAVNLQSDLTALGFTEYEAKVYLALLGDSPATGYQISKKSGVPRSMVYEALGRLHARGAVLETVEGRSTLYRPLPPDLLLDRQEEERRQLLSNLRDGLRRLYNAPEEARAWSVSGRQTVLTYASRLIREAEQEIYMVLNDEDLGVLHAEIKAACDRDLDVNALLTGEDTLECGHVVHHPPLESELQGLHDALLIVADNDEALVASASQATATITGNPNLVLIARQFVWMEIFTQRIYARLGSDLLDRLDPEDRRILESLDVGENHPSRQRRRRGREHGGRHHDGGHSRGPASE
jgi:sugar-specific transcriptional regulator TrmB